MYEKLDHEYAPDTSEAAVRRLKHEFYVEPYYGYAMLFLREYILGSQTREKLKQMGYSDNEQNFLSQNNSDYHERLYEAAYQTWNRYVRLTNQLFPSEESVGIKTWTHVWEETAGAIWDELSARHPHKQNTPWEIPRPESPSELDELQADSATFSEIRACFEDTND